LIPGSSHEQIVRGFKFLWAKSKGPNWTLALIDGEKVSSGLVLHQDCAIKEPNGKQLTVWRPVAGNTPCRSLGLVDTLAIGHPEAKVDARTGRERLENWIEAKSLNLVIMRILE